MRETAHENGINGKIRFRHRVAAAAWSNQDARWTVDIRRGGADQLQFPVPVCRLLNHMRRNGFAWCVPRNNDPTLSVEPWVDFSSGYFQRALHLLPRQGSKLPWKLHQNYIRDIHLLRRGTLEDGVLAVTRAS